MDLSNSSNNNNNSNNKRRMNVSKKFNYKYCVMMCSIYLSFAFILSLSGSSLLDLSQLTNSSVAHVSYGPVIVTSAPLIGGPIFGFLFHIINNDRSSDNHSSNDQIALVLILWITGSALAAVPSCRSLMQYLTLSSVLGFLASGIDILCSSWILLMSSGSNTGGGGAPMQALHLSLSIGATLGPMIVSPFLSSSTSLTASANNSTAATVDNSSSMIYIPYAFAGSFIAANGVVLLILYYYQPFHQSLHIYQSINSKDDDDDIAVGDDDVETHEEVLPERQPLLLSYEKNSEKKEFMMIMLLGSLILAFYTGIEVTISIYLPTFVTISKLNLSKSRGALVAGIYNASNTTARIIITAFGCCSSSSRSRSGTNSRTSKIVLNPQTMLYISLSLMIIGNLIIYCTSDTSETSLWIGSLISGFGSGPIVPSALTHMSHMIHMSSREVGIISMARSLSTLVAPPIIGHMIQRSPLVLIQFNLLCVICMMITLSIIQIRRSLPLW